MKDFEVTEKIGTDGLKIVVIGVGGAGCSLIDTLGDSPIADKVKLVAIDSSFSNDLSSNRAPHKLQLEFTFKGFDGHSPAVYRDLALNHYDDIKDMLTKFEGHNNDSL